MTNPATDRPFASVVIPTCNRRAVLARCLDALALQTFANFEVIIVDDASTDDTAAMLAQFASLHPSMVLRTLRNDHHAGANASRNRGIRESRGEIVAFLDSDCIAEPDWLDKLVAGFTAPNVAAVTGLVTDPPSRNIYERVLRGVARVHGKGDAPRLVGGNMAVRKERLASSPFDEDNRWKSNRSGAEVASPVCDEESIFLSLRAEGWAQRVVPEAMVVHEHPYDRRAFFKHAWAGGRGAAFLVYKYSLPPRLDVLPLLLTYASLPLVGIDLRMGVIPAAFFLTNCAALLFNEISRKGKNFGEAFVCLPLVLIYYHVRLAGYIVESAGRYLGLQKTERIRLNKR